MTGASRGLGAALARAYAANGAAVVLCARSRDPLRELAEDLEAAGARVVWSALDVTDAGAVEALVRSAAEQLGAVDVLVNNASSLGPRTPLRNHPLDEWRAVLETNLTGALVVCQAVIPGMRERGGGSIINVSSGVGNQPRADWGAYAISKRALEALSENLALEEEPSGIRVNVVDPGRMRTAMRRAAYPDEDPSAPPPPERVTDVFLWLASAASEGVTGQRFRAQEWP